MPKNSRTKQFPCQGASIFLNAFRMPPNSLSTQTCPGTCRTNMDLHGRPHARIQHPQNFKADADPRVQSPKPRCHLEVGQVFRSLGGRSDLGYGHARYVDVLAAFPLAMIRNYRCSSRGYHSAVGRGANQCMAAPLQLQSCHCEHATCSQSSN